MPNNKIKKQTVMFCIKQEKMRENYVPYMDFYPSAEVIKICFGVVSVKVLVKEGEGKLAGHQYYGWWDNKDNKFHHVYYHKDLVNMCFPYGTKILEERGDGKLLPVTVAEVKK